jgi:DNA-binding IclR family transcriptional regulator
MERSKAESFTAYLEARQKERAAPAAPASGGTSLSLLAALASAPQWAMALAELQQASGMHFADFSQSVKRLVDTGYLTVGGQPGSETAQLTKLGSEVAALARAS